MPYYIHNQTYWHFTGKIYKNTNHLILYTHADIYEDFIFALNYTHFYSTYIYIQMIHVELKTLFHLSSTSYEILLNTFITLNTWNTRSRIWIKISIASSNKLFKTSCK